MHVCDSTQDFITVADGWADWESSSKYGGTSNTLNKPLATACLENDNGRPDGNRTDANKRLPSIRFHRWISSAGTRFGTATKIVHYLSYLTIKWSAAFHQRSCRGFAARCGDYLKIMLQRVHYTVDNCPSFDCNVAPYANCCVLFLVETLSRRKEICEYTGINTDRI